MPEATDLQRFIAAQEGAYAGALAELERGRKRSHWIWFIFPQLVGLGHSAMAQRYGLADLAEARAYLAHPVLGARLRACVRAMLVHRAQPADLILGCTDAMKFRSCLTLFHVAAPQETLFSTALDAFFAAEPDAQTLRLLGADALP